MTTSNGIPVFTWLFFWMMLGSVAANFILLIKRHYDGIDILPTIKTAGILWPLLSICTLVCAAIGI
jgi:uncharacterized membrane protein YjjP (DUF1212 family)